MALIIKTMTAYQRQSSFDRPSARDMGNKIYYPTVDEVRKPEQAHFVEMTEKQTLSTFSKPRWTSGMVPASSKKMGAISGVS